MKSKRIGLGVIHRKTTVYDEFCEEMDLFSEDMSFPDWIFDYREHHLSKINSKLIKFARKLKSKGVKFKILHPMEIDRKWKFADIYIPSTKTVVMVTTMPHSPGWLTQRAVFFADRCRVFELDGHESESRLDEIICKCKLN